MRQDHQGAGSRSKVYSENAHVPFGPGGPVLAASRLNFRTTVNSMR